MLIQTAYGKFIPIYQIHFDLKRRREDVRMKQNETAEALLLI